MGLLLKSPTSNIFLSMHSSFLILSLSNSMLVSQIITNYLVKHMRKYATMYDNFRKTIKLQSLSTSEEVIHLKELHFSSSLFEIQVKKDL